MTQVPLNKKLWDASVGNCESRLPAPYFCLQQVRAVVQVHVRMQLTPAPHGPEQPGFAWTLQQRWGVHAAHGGPPCTLCRVHGLPGAAQRQGRDNELQHDAGGAAHGYYTCMHACMLACLLVSINACCTQACAAAWKAAWKRLRAPANTRNPFHNAGD